MRNLSAICPAVRRPFQKNSWWGRGVAPTTPLHWRGLRETKYRIIHQYPHLSGCLRVSEDVWGGWRLTFIACISYFEGHPHQVTYTWLLESWHRSVGDQKYIAITRFPWLYEGYDYKVFERNVAIKRGGFYSELIRLYCCAFLSPYVTWLWWQWNANRNGRCFVKYVFCTSILPSNILWINFILHVS